MAFYKPTSGYVSARADDVKEDFIKNKEILTTTIKANQLIAHVDTKTRILAASTTSYYTYSISTKSSCDIATNVQTITGSVVGKPDTCHPEGSGCYYNNTASNDSAKCLLGNVQMDMKCKEFTTVQALYPLLK